MATVGGLERIGEPAGRGPGGRSTSSHLSTAHKAASTRGIGAANSKPLVQYRATAGRAEPASGAGRHRRGSVRGEGNGQAQQATECREEACAPGASAGNHRGDGENVDKKRQAGGNGDAHSSLEEGWVGGKSAHSTQEPTEPGRDLCGLRRVRRPNTRSRLRPDPTPRARHAVCIVLTPWRPVLRN